MTRWRDGRPTISAASMPTSRCCSEERWSTLGECPRRRVRCPSAVGLSPHDLSRRRQRNSIRGATSIGSFDLRYVGANQTRGLLVDIVVTAVRVVLLKMAKGDG